MISVHVLDVEYPNTMLHPFTQEDGYDDNT